MTKKGVNVKPNFTSLNFRCTNVTRMSNRVVENVTVMVRGSSLNYQEVVPELRALFGAQEG